MSDEEVLDQIRASLSAALRRLRTAAGLSTTELARRAEWSQSKVSKMEHAETKPSPDDVRLWCEITGADSGLATSLAQDAARIAGIRRTWRTSLAAGAAARQREMGDLEAIATRGRILTPTVIPGLLCTRAYAEGILRLVDREQTQTETAAGAVARVARQGVLINPAGQWQFVVGELGLAYRPEGLLPEHLPELAERVLFLGALPGVDVRILPQPTPWPVLPSEALSLYDVQDGPVAIIESTEGERTLIGDETLGWQERFAAAWDLSVAGEEAEALIRHWLS